MCWLSGEQQLLQSCQFLQALFVTGEWKGAESLSFKIDAEQGSSLTELHLERMCCNLLDLRRTSNLTSVEVVKKMPCRQGRTKFELTLPDVLQSLRLVGGAIFYPVNMPKLDRCSQLTSLVTGNESVCLHVPLKPSLPSSLKRLEVRASDEKTNGLSTLTGAAWMHVFTWKV